MAETTFIQYNPTGLTQPVFPLTDVSMSIYSKYLSRYYNLSQGTKVQNSVLPNSVPGFLGATVSNPTGIVGGTTTKGLAILNPGILTLPTYFDVTTLPADQDIVIAVALTPANGQSTGQYFIAGKGNSPVDVQWALFYNGGSLQFQMANGSSIVSASSPPDGARHLLTIHMAAQTSDGKRVIRLFDGLTLLGTQNLVLPANTHAPVIGNGFFSAVTATFHALHLFSPAAGFDPTSWITTELAKLTSDLA